jgi:hypothetical protein
MDKVVPLFKSFTIIFYLKILELGKVTFQTVKVEVIQKEIESV